MLASKAKFRLAGIIVLIFFILFWWAASRGFSRIVLPSPVEVASAFFEMAISGMILFHVSRTFCRVVLSFSIALGLSLLLSFLMGRSSSTHGFLERVIILFQSIPSAIWIIMAIIWFGISEMAPIFVVWAIAFPILALNIFEGIKNVDSNLVEMAETFGHSKQSVFTKVTLPSIFPYILAGSRVTMSLAWKVSVIAEVLGAQSGIGYAISFAWERLRTDEIFAWAIVIILVLQAFDQLIFRRLEKKVKKYQIASQSN